MKKNVEAIHPLTPVQEGMLFHSLAAPGAGAYVGQILCELDGELDPDAFRQAWQRLLERHPVLRTAFIWEEVERPLQIVLRQVELPLEHQDARGWSDAEIEERVAAHLREDLERGFDLAKPPLLRLWLLRTGDRVHRLLWTQHHATLDGWSLALLLEEVFTLYEALAAGREPALPARPPYRNYLRWLERRDPAPAEEYWRATLAGADLPTPLELEPPADAPAGRGEARWRLGAHHTAALEDFARQHRLTLNHLVTAAWAAFLGRSSGRDDVVFGSVVSGRPPELHGVETMVGLFINTLPRRLAVAGDRPLGEWLEEIRHGQLELQAHESTPLTRIQEWSGVEAGTPLFESIVVFENYPISAAAERGPEGAEAAEDRLVIRAASSRESAHYPLVLLATPGERLELGLIYDRQRFAPSAAGRLLRQLETWLEALPGHAAGRLGEVPFLSDAQRAQALFEWNDAAAELPDAELSGHHDGMAATLHGRIAIQAARAPEAVALEFEDQTLTYGEWLGRARHLAWRLHELGIGPESVVAVAVERSLELMVGLLGVLEAGAAYLPLDPEYPPSRLAFMLEDSGAAALLVSGALPAGLEPGSTLPVLRLSGEERQREDPPPTARDDRNAAYVIYTSGSTGRPKGAVNSHSGIVNRLLWMQAEYRLTSHDRVLQKTPISFDVSVWELFWPALGGARLVLARPGGHRDGTYLRRLIAERGITTLHFVPAMLEAFLEEPGLEELQSVRRVIASGEALSGTLAARFAERLPETARLHNLYGPTEAAIDVSHHPCRAVDSRGTAVPIGRPVWNTRLLVLDRGGRPALIGAPGHLHLGGVQLARGYHRRPALTAASFVPDPFSDGRPGERLYKSGDLVRRRGDGEIEFLGRIDHQVKLRGFRVELGEIEAALARQPEVISAVVQIRDDLPGGRGLVAWVAARDGSESNDGESSGENLRATLAAELPEYMVPAAIEVLDELPKNPSGKADRRALAALPPPGGAARRDAWVAPRTPTEERLALIWEQVLDLDESAPMGGRAGTTDSFFELGGHSLLALRVVARIRQEFEIDLPVGSLFDHPSLAALAAEVERRKAAGEGGGSTALVLPRIAPDAARAHEPFTLTDVQQAYWIGRRGDFELGSVATQVYLEFDIQALDLERLEAAWRRLIERHGMLRAVIDGDGRQRILPEVPAYEIAVHDLRELGGEELEAALEERRHELSHRILPSDRWPLFDAQASLLPGDRARLHLVVDALIADAFSYQILSRELARLYAEPAAELPPLEISFRDYVVAERGLRGGEAWQRAREYWRERLADLPPAPQLPLARRPGELEEQRFERRRHGLPAERWHAFERRARQLRLTPSAALLNAFGTVLAAWSKSPRFTLNLTLFQRLPLHPDVERLLGDFTSLTLLAHDPAPGASFVERARSLQQQLWTDLENRLVSGVEVLRDLRRAAGEDGGAALMPVVFTSTLDLPAGRRGEDDFELPGEVVYSITQTPQVWLDHQVGIRDGELVLIWDALEALFPSGLLDAMWSAYVSLVERLATDAASWDEKLGAGFLLPADQRDLIAAANDTAAPTTGELLHVHALRGGETRPDAPAVIGGGRTVSHGELRAMAARLGQRLRDAGAEPGTLIAVVLEKSWEQTAAVLGVLASGAAYLPIDPALPGERLRHLLEVGEAKLAVTRRRFTEGDERLDWPDSVRPIHIEEATPDAAPAELPAPVQQEEDLAYVIFTSGSTGRPKGVMIDHRGAVNTLVDIRRRFALAPEDRALALSALNFDLSVFDVFGLLGAGGALVVPDDLLRRDPAHWAELMTRHRITVWNSVPALLDLYVEYLEQHPERVPEHLRLVLLSGDWIPLALPDRLRALCPNAEIVSLGGATEGSIWSILFPISEVDPSWPSIPYGRPMENQHFYVVDGGLESRPVWVPGELMIGGIGVAQGYWRDPERTGQRFIVHPESGERLYRTGDLGRLLPSGEIEFLGREDFQVKIRGHRVELGEIEAALTAHPAVADAVVTAPASAAATAGGQRRLIAHVVSRGTEGETTDAEALRQHLASRLPAYMVPAVYDLRDALPLTANGKIDRGALERDARHLGAATDATSSPAIAAGASPWIERLHPLVSEIFTVEGGLEPEADLLQLGASSVDLIRIGNRLEAEFDYRPPIHEIYAEPSVAGLARLYESHAADPTTASEEIPAVAGVSPEEAVAASFPLLRDPAERETFKERRPGLRPAFDEPAVELERDSSDAVERLFETRRSYRHYRQEPLPAAAFGRFLSALREERLDGAPKYLFGSAGGIYPVQTYVAVKPGRIAGLDGGAYYYHPVEHRLLSLDPSAVLPRELCDPLANGPILEEAAFALFLVGEMAAVGPIYGANGYRFALLEAGYMSQLLMMLAPENGLGLCPISRLDFDLMRDSFGLGESQVFLHCLVGGAIDPERRSSRVRLDLAPGWEEEREEGEI